MASSEPVWDAENLVWVGDAAASGDLEIPDPLCIFGYGSLCWRSDFPYADQFVGRIHGWRRLFAQQSADHRGTPAAPGLVATVLTDDELEQLSLRAPGEAASSCCGMCYRVAPDDVPAVLSNLCLLYTSPSPRD